MGVQRDGSEVAVIVYFGDGATSQGDVKEAFVFAGVFNAPVVFFCQNNQWAISEPIEMQTRIPLYQRALGFGFPGVRVDGNDVLACLAVTRAALEARAGQGPTLIEAYTYRMGPHTTSDDPTRYRQASEIEMWRLRDPVERVNAYLSRSGAADEGSSSGRAGGRRAGGARAARLARDGRPGAAEHVRRRLRRVHAAPAAAAGRVRGVPRHLRGGQSLMATITIAKALNEGLRKAMEDDPKVLIMGEDVGKLGGVFRVTDGLQKDFGEDRVIDTPLAESGIIGTAIGLAMRGYRPVCEIQFDGFVYPAFDQIVTQLAKMRYRSKGNVRLPVTIRIPFGGGIGAVEHHSESPEAYFSHTAGLRVVACSNPVDAYFMIQQAVASDDPVVFFEPKRRYWEKAEVDTAATPDPLHSGRVVRAGRDITVVAYGPMVKIALEAATAAEQDGR